MGKYTADAKELLKLVGGRENIAAVSHCITRMRFALVEPAKADIKAIEAMKVVKGSFTQSGQFQVIIGNTVPEFYNDFIKEAGIEGGSKEDVKQAAKKNQNVLQRIVTALAEIFAPLIPAIVTGGLILGFRNVLEGIAFYEDGTKTLVQVSVFWNGVNHFLWLLGEAIFHMLPVGVCWSVTRKMKTDQMLGIVLGLTLVSGQLLNAYGVAGAAADAIPKWDFGFFQINMIGYQAQIIPAIMAAFTLVYLEKFFRKITPEVISMIVVPFCSLLLAVVAAHFILGPIGWKLGEALSSVIYAGITGSFKVVFGAIFGFFYAPLVITGLHHMSNAIDLQLIATYEGTMLWPMIALSNIAQGSAVLSMIYMQRKNSVAQEVNVPSTISCYLGVTEPAMFGVNLKYKFPFLAGMIGSALAAIVCVATGTTARSVGIGGIPGILSIKTQYMLSFAICMLIAIAVPFLLTVVFGKKKLSYADMNGDDADSVAVEPVERKEEPAVANVAASGSASKEMKAFLSGKVIPLKEVGDGVFSEGIMGEGLAIFPENELLYSPVDAEITAIMPDSRHACGLKMDNGMEVLLHIGLDTVNMKGDGFEYMIKAGQKVKAGDELIRFSKEKIKAAGYQDVTIFVVTNPAVAKNLTFKTGFNAKAKDSVIASFQ